MITSLFESFDPLLRFFHINLLTIIVISLLPLNIISMHLNRWNKTKFIISNYIFSELSASLRKNYETKAHILSSIFLSIIIINFLGLFPYVYTITRQIILNLPLALTFWTSFIFYSIFFNTNNFLRHLVPLSTPLALSQFIVVIESIRQLIRPITLSVRLCANITAGHILIALCSKPIFMFNTFSIVLLILILLEIAVAIIQAYVFSMLLSIYLRETE